MGRTSKLGVRNLIITRRKEFRKKCIKGKSIFRGFLDVGNGDKLSVRNLSITFSKTNK